MPDPTSHEVEPKVPRDARPRIWTDSGLDGVTRRPTPALVIAFAALFAALTGAASALPGTNTVNSGDIVNGQVKAPDLDRRAIRSRHIKNGHVRAPDLDAGLVTTAKIRDGHVRTPDLAPGAVTSDRIAPDAVDSSRIADGEVATADLGDVRSVGTPSNNPLELVSGGFGALRIDPARFSDAAGAPAPNVIAGSPENSVADGVINATIAGGGLLHSLAHASRNRVLADGGAVGGGEDNRTSGNNATVGGGESNAADGFAAVAAGGDGNTASGTRTTVGGGSANAAGGRAATVPGGLRNNAAGDFSFAAGRRADAVEDGTFVWADSNNAPFGPSRADQFRARATGGVEFVTGISIFGDSTTGVFVSPGGGAWQSRSDRNSKENLERVDPAEVLAKLAEIPISTWNWKAQDDGIRHMGPMAQDFADAFGLGSDRKTISTVDADGVALAAIQGLSRGLAAERRKRRAQEHRIARLERRLERLAE